jgi:WD40 repeat protein
VWDVDRVTGRWSIRESLEGHGGDVPQVEIDPAGTRLVTVSNDNRLIVWNVGPDGGFGASWPSLGDRWFTSRPVVVQPGRSVVALTRPVAPSDSDDPLFDPATHLVSASFLDAGTGDVVGEVELGETVLGAFISGSLAVSPDGRLVAASSVQATTILDARTHDVVHRIVLPPTGDTGADGRPFPTEIVWSVGWTPDGSRLLIGTLGEWATNSGGRIVVVDAATWEVEERIDVGVSPVATEPSPDGRWIAVASAGTGQVVILDADTLEVRHTLDLDFDDWPWDVSFSPDGELLAAAGQNGFLYVADTETWDVRVPVAVNDGIVTQLEWLPDGRTVAAAGFDRTVTLFDVETARVRAMPLPLPEASDYVTYLMPEPEDELVVTAGDRPGHRYPMDPAVWLREACAVVGRDLTRAEWDRYLPDREYEATCAGLV